MSEYKFVKYETFDEGRVVRILLNRPEARNAQNRGMLVELDEAFLAAEADDEVRVVILGGEGLMFSSGHDMGSKVSMEEFAPGDRSHALPRILFVGGDFARKGGDLLLDVIVRLGGSLAALVTGNALVSGGIVTGASEKGNVPVLYARVMESPVAAIEFGYPVRFGVAWTEVTAGRARIVTSATVLIPNLISPAPSGASGRLGRSAGTVVRRLVAAPHFIPWGHDITVRHASR